MVKLWWKCGRFWMKLADILVKDFNKFFITIFQKLPSAYIFINRTNLSKYVKIVFGTFLNFNQIIKHFQNFLESNHKISIELNMWTYRTVSCGCYFSISFIINLIVVQNWWSKTVCVDHPWEAPLPSLVGWSSCLPRTVEKLDTQIGCIRQHHLILFYCS